MTVCKPPELLNLQPVRCSRRSWTSAAARRLILTIVSSPARSSAETTARRGPSTQYWTEGGGPSARIFPVLDGRRRSQRPHLPSTGRKEAVPAPSSSQYWTEGGGPSALLPSTGRKEAVPAPSSTQVRAASERLTAPVYPVADRTERLRATASPCTRRHAPVRSMPRPGGHRCSLSRAVVR
jgi:hypothetical protein